MAGHIPGALSAPHMDNLQADGRFKPTGELRQQYEELLAGAPVENAVFYCGSGVTSIHGLLALEHIGMPGARLYVGSWSEWIADPGRPIATGPNP